MVGLQGTMTSSQFLSQLGFFTQFSLSAFRNNQGKKCVTDKHQPVNKAPVA
jgi:hypothetical protein